MSTKIQPVYIPAAFYFTIPEVAGMYGVIPRTVNNWLLSGNLIGIKTGIGWLIEAGQLETFVPPKRGRQGKE